MSEMIAEELAAAVSAIVCGAQITFVYDLLRIFRRGVSHGNFWIGAEDFVFWIWTAFWVFSVLYRKNDGNLRIYAMIFMGAGMILYHRIFSDKFVRICGTIFQKIVKLMGFPYLLLKKLIQFMGKKLKKLMLSFIMKPTGGKIHDKDEKT